MFDIFKKAQNNAVVNIMATKIAELGNTIKSLRADISVKDNTINELKDKLDIKNQEIKKLQQQSVKDIKGYQMYLKTVQYIPVEAYRVYDKNYGKDFAHALVGTIVSTRNQDINNEENKRQAWLDIYSGINKVTGKNLFVEFEQYFTGSHAAYLNMIIANEVWHDLFVAVANIIIYKTITEG